MGDEVPVPGDRGQEHQGVRGPGHRPAEQHHQTGSPQLPLRLRGVDRVEFYRHDSDYHQPLLEEVGPRHVPHLLSKLLYTASGILTQVNTHIHTASP